MAGYTPTLLPATINGAAASVRLQVLTWPSEFNDSGRPDRAARFELECRFEPPIAADTEKLRKCAPEMTGYISADRRRATVMQWYRNAIDKGAGFGTASIRLLDESLGPFDSIGFEWITNGHASKLYEAAIVEPGRLSELEPKIADDAFVRALRAAGFKRVEIMNQNSLGARPVASLIAHRSTEESIAVAQRSAPNLMYTRVVQK